MKLPAITFELLLFLIYIVKIKNYSVFKEHFFKLGKSANPNFIGDRR